MGNCALKPKTTEGDAPVTEEKAVESTEREVVLETKVIANHDDQTTPRSLGDMLEEEEKKPEVVEVAPPTEEKAEASEPKVEETKTAEVAAAPAEATAA